ncbi:MAG: D-glycero-beta-D-manno-heptose 1-phosphate adenylyltransferase [Candidatus Omnitrophica bacterium]|nr:D-glycero-beta-D-manno-heptose 1-phosphate adenylyltransferase [Candidatus Omnitrophota bacterium]
MRVSRTKSFSDLKIKSLKELKSIILRLKEQGKRIVFTNGCFDLLHYGHIRYLEEAKNKGDILVVAINSDSSVRRLKGAPRPLVKEDDRARILAGLESIDYVIIFKEDTPISVIRELKPDVLIKGSDWQLRDIVGADFVKSYGGEVLRIRLIPNRSTTNLIKKIVRAFEGKQIN